MDQRDTTRSILAVLIAAALVVSVGSLATMYTLPADATKPKHNDDDNGDGDGDDNGNSNGDNVVNTLPLQSQMTPDSMGTSNPNTGGVVGGGDFATQHKSKYNHNHNNYNSNKKQHHQTQHVDKS